MPTLPAQVFTSFTHFAAMPEAADGGHLELRDGIIGHLTGEPWWHLELRRHLRDLFRPVADHYGILAFEWMPYRPAPDLQSWYATALGVIEAERWNALRATKENYPVYAPTMIIEVASEWNSVERIVQQRRIAMSAGTREFWIIDLQERCVRVTRGGGETMFFFGEVIPTELFPNSYWKVSDLIGCVVEVV